MTMRFEVEIIPDSGGSIRPHGFLFRPSGRVPISIHDWPASWDSEAAAYSLTPIEKAEAATMIEQAVALKTIASPPPPPPEPDYTVKRRRAYPSLADQFDMLYHDQLSGTTTWRDAIAAVKARHPKP